MKQTKENKQIIERTDKIGDVEDNIDNKFDSKQILPNSEQVLVDPELIVICKHCGRKVDQSTLIGLSLKCPLCGKPQNGHPIDPTLDPYDNMTVICKHCGGPINQARLRGISLICPLCNMPQNGQPHPKLQKH